jgi:hypothetical protein
MPRRPLRRLAAAAVTASVIFASTYVPSAPAASPAARYGAQPSPDQDTLVLNADQRLAIADHLRDCWTKDANPPDADKMRVMLTVTTDQDGVARKVQVADDDDLAGLDDFSLRDLTERVTLMILNPRCEPLPLPSAALGKVNVLTFPFSP